MIPAKRLNTAVSYHDLPCYQPDGTIEVFNVEHIHGNFPKWGKIDRNLDNSNATDQVYIRFDHQNNKGSNVMFLMHNGSARNDYNHGIYNGIICITTNEQMWSEPHLFISSWENDSIDSFQPIEPKIRKEYTKYKVKFESGYETETIGMEKSKRTYLKPVTWLPPWSWCMNPYSRIINRKRTKPFKISPEIFTKDISDCVHCKQDIKNKKLLEVLICGHHYHSNCLKNYKKPNGLFRCGKCNTLSF